MGVQTSRFANAWTQIRQTYMIMSNFHPLEVVGHGSKTQLQMGENLN